MSTAILAESTGPASEYLVQRWLLEQGAPLLDRLGVPTAGPVFDVAYSFLIVGLVFTPAVLLFAMFAIWWERKVAGHIQARLGPNRVGPIGILQSLADGIKLLGKEDLCPAEADKLLFRIAPYLAFAPAFAAWLALPYGPNMVFEPRLSSGVFWILAILSIEVMGVILAGWASNNKWSVYGAMREAAQMVSYEIPLGIAIIVAIAAAGTLNLVQLGHLQGGGLHTWLIFRNPFTFLAFVFFFVASLASNKRAPFDLPESESELVAGFHTEYSGLRWAFFFFAEYGSMFVVGGICAALFLGSWNDPFGIIGHYHAKWIGDSTNTGKLILLNLVAVGVFVTKALIIVYVQMWLRWTLPRPRIDQVLYACIKVLLPGACALLAGAALWQLFVPDRPGLPWVEYAPFSLEAWTQSPAGNAVLSLLVQSVLAIFGITLFGGATLWIAYSFVTGRQIKQRLTDPAPIEMDAA